MAQTPRTPHYPAGVGCRCSRRDPYGACRHSDQIQAALGAAINLANFYGMDAVVQEVQLAQRALPPVRSGEYFKTIMATAVRAAVRTVETVIPE